MIKKFLEDNNVPAYRLNQFNKHFYDEYVDSFDQITTWSKDLREKLKQAIPFSTLVKEKSLVSEKKDVIKVLFSLQADSQKKIETVLMKHKDGRNTVCVSCMVGCPVACSFCATGKMGFHGNLTAREIVDQVLYFQRLLKKDKQKVSNIVFMGMGEPLLNLKNVQEAIDIFTDPKKMGFSSRRITVSTSGYVPQLKQLIEDGYRGRLAVSLHAPNQELREELMPVAKVYPLHQLMEILDDFTKLTNKRISYEYTLIEEVNDLQSHAKQLIKLLKGRLAHVNLIPINPIQGSKFQRPSKNRIFKFASFLKQAKIPYTIRITMGEDIKAACGQLSGK